MTTWPWVPSSMPTTLTSTLSKKDIPTCSHQITPRSSKTMNSLTLDNVQKSRKLNILTYLNSCIRRLKWIIAYKTKSTRITSFRVSHYLKILMKPKFKKTILLTNSLLHKETLFPIGHLTNVVFLKCNIFSFFHLTPKIGQLHFFLRSNIS